MEKQLRQGKINKDNIELINYKLDQLQQTMSDGFRRLDLQGQDLIKRVSVLEIWQARVDSDIKSLATISQREDNWSGSAVKIVLAVFGVLATLATAILYLVKGR